MRHIGDPPWVQTKWTLPPRARLTLEAIREPGEWDVRGLKVQRRLFEMSVAAG